MPNGIATFGWTGGTFTFQDQVAPVSVYEITPLERESYGLYGPVVFDQGGDIFRLEVRGSHKLDGRRGAEEYAYSLLRTMLTSGVGTIGSASGVFANCFFREGECEIVAEKCDFSLQFIHSGSTAGVTAGALTAGTPGGGSTGSAMFWAVGANTLGDIAYISRMEGSRAVVANHVPRCRGVSIFDHVMGASIQFELEAGYTGTTREHVQAHVYNLDRSIGPAGASLMGNGQTYSGCYLGRMPVSEDDNRLGKLRARIIQAVPGTSAGIFNVYVDGTLGVGVEADSVTASWLQTDQAFISVPGYRHDEIPSWLSNNNAIRIEQMEGTTGHDVFSGWVQTSDLGGVQREGGTFRCYGSRYFLDHRIKCKVEGSLAKEWMPNGGTDSSGPERRIDVRWLNGGVVTDVLEHLKGIPGTPPLSDLPTHHEMEADVPDPYMTAGDYLASYEFNGTAGTSISELLTMPMPGFSIDNDFVGDVLAQLVSISPECAWRIDPASRDLLIRNLTTLGTVGIAAGEIGHVVNETGKDYRIISNPIRFSLEGVFSRVTLQGMDLTVEVRPATENEQYGQLEDPIVIAAWGEADVPEGWNLGDWNAGTYDGTPGQWVYRLWKIRRHGWRQLAGDATYPVVDDDNDQRALNAVAVMQGTLFRDIDDDGKFTRVTAEYISVAPDYGCFATQTPKPHWGTEGHAIAFWGRVKRPFYVSYPTSGYGGGAYDTYALEADYYLRLPRMEDKTSRLGMSVAFTSQGTKAWNFDIRDDGPAMMTLAEGMHTMYSTELASCDVELDGASLLNPTLDNRVVLTNLARWPTYPWLVLEITAYPKLNRTVIHLASTLRAATKYDFGYRYSTWWAQREQVWENLKARKFAELGIRVANPFLLL